MARPLIPPAIYIFEFKYNRSVREAFDRIRDRDYAGRYALVHRQVYLIGANFIEDKDRRGLEYEICKGTGVHDGTTCE